MVAGDVITGKRVNGGDVRKAMMPAVCDATRRVSAIAGGTDEPGEPSHTAKIPIRPAQCGASHGRVALRSSGPSVRITALGLSMPRAVYRVLASTRQRVLGRCFR